MTELINDWPPPYTVRNSARAKQVILQISPRQGLVVIVPQRRRQPQQAIDELLNQKKSWIQKNLLQVQQNLKLNPGLFSLPDSLELRAIGKIIRLDYQETEHKKIKIIPIHKTLADDGLYTLESYLLIGPIRERSQLIKTLKHWLKQIAKTHLLPWLATLSVETGLFYQSASVRSQSTLWGSCTAAKKISLNIKLLFLNPILTRYVLLHELCHTQHMNHSKRYWNLLKRFDTDCLKHRALLRHAEHKLLPAWIEEKY